MSTHHEDSPERRYSWLHRAIEQGHATDNIWAELSRVCCRLGYKTEAIKGIHSIQDPEFRYKAEMFLVRQGLLDHPSSLDNKRLTAQKPTRRTLQEEVMDSFSYLFLEHMPFTVMASALVFPVVLGLGGVLTTGSEMWVFPAIALLPVLFAVGLVGALSHQIILEGSKGIVEPPRLPDVSDLVAGSGRFLRDSMIVAIALLTPGALAIRLGVTLYYSMPLLLAGASLLPMALSLCLVRNDFRGLTPRVLFPAVWRSGLSYGYLVALAGLLFAPAIAAGLLTGQSDLYLRLSFISPLAIAPLFVVSRLMGRILFLNKHGLGDLIRDRLDTHHTSTNQPTAVPASHNSRRSKAKTNRHSSKPKTHRHPSKPKTNRHPREVSAAAQQKWHGSFGNLGAPTHPEALTAPIRVRAPLDKPPSPDQPASKPSRRIKVPLGPAGVGIQETVLPDVVGEAVPDLLHMPGATVLRGEDRENSGAAAPPPRL